MDLNSDGPAKRTRSKNKQSSAAKTAAPRAGKTPVSSKPKLKPQQPPIEDAVAEDSTIEVTAMTALPPPEEEEMLVLIRTAAYYLAEQRQFQPGHELEDWLQAERYIRAMHS